MGQQRRRYARIHRDALFYPLGGIVAELEALPPGPDNGRTPAAACHPLLSARFDKIDNHAIAIFLLYSPAHP